MCRLTGKRGTGLAAAAGVAGVSAPASGVAIVVGQTTVAIMALCAVLPHYILVALISLTATFPRVRQGEMRHLKFCEY